MKPTCKASPNTNTDENYTTNLDQDHSQIHVGSPEQPGHAIRPIKNNYLRMKRGKILFFIWIVLALITFSYSAVAAGENESRDHHETPQTEHAGGAQTSHGTDMSPLFFVITGLFIGTATRHFLRRGPLPFTVSLIVIGLILGMISRAGYFSGALSLFDHSLTWAGNIDPHLILFIFLPTLIFEAAFNMDVHTFKKSFTNSLILAVPGILVALGLTALIIMGIVKTGLGLAQWNWTAALMFGALISATDPVSVVALLKELGVSKKLSTLIDGESILNDGTAIVLFMVFYLPLAGQPADANPFLSFLRVALGGMMVGLVIGWILIHWIQKVYNDPMFEITTIIGGSYLTFFLAEIFFHVSGVLGLCALGIYCAGIGRTKFSPSVHHFLHEFWELAVFIANSLIFLIVGVVIAKRIHFTLHDFLLLGIVYAGLLAARFAMLWLFYPIMRRIGYGVKPADILVSWWGGLRGAIALALALVVAGNDAIPAAIRNQVLFLTAGTVILTSLINATTTKALINWLGLARPTEDKQRMMAANLSFIRQTGEKTIEKLKSDRFMSGADWNKVNSFLPRPQHHVSADSAASIAEIRKRILTKEKSAYWELFEEGLVDGDAVLELSAMIDVLLDDDGQSPLSKRKDIEYLWRTPRIIDFLQKLPLAGHLAQKAFFNILSKGYDSARAFVHAQDEMLKTLKSMSISGLNAEADKSMQSCFETLENEINENRIQGLTFLRNLKETYPDIYKAIETRQAIRVLLNHEKQTIQKMARQHRLTEDEALAMEEAVNEKIVQLMNSSDVFKPPSPFEILKRNELFDEVNDEILRQIISSSQVMVYAVGEDILKQDKPSDEVYFILSGTAKVVIDREVREILQAGDCFGETGMLTGITRTGTVTAESPLSVLRISKGAVTKISAQAPQFIFNLWELAAKRMTENILLKTEPYSSMKKNTLRQWIADGELIVLSAGESTEMENLIGVCVQGSVAPASAPSQTIPLFSLFKEKEITAKEKSWVFTLEQSDKKDL